MFTPESNNQPIVPQAPKPKSTASRYTDPTKTISNRGLKLSEWYIRHNELVKKILTSILMVWCGISIGIGLVGWGYYLFAGYSHVEDIMHDLGREHMNVSAIHTAFGPKALEAGAIDVFKNTPGKFDFVAHVKNPNTRWIATITYEFSYGGGKTTSHTVTILPGKTQTAGAFGETIEFFPTNVHLTIPATEWQRVSPHKILDPQGYIQSRTTFDVVNFTFTPADRTTEIVTNAIAFDVINNSAYSFWEPVFDVLYVSGNQIVGAKEISIASFKSGETRHVEIKTLVNIGRVDGVELVPLVNPFDDSVFIPVGI